MNKPTQYIPIISDGAIARRDLGEGKIIPVLVLDCTNHPDFLNLIYIHKTTPPGDVVSRWGYSIFNKRYVVLELTFSKPVEVSVQIKFDLRSQAALADSIVQSKAVYLQPSESGIRVIEGLDKPKIVIEIPPKTKLPKWDEILLHQIAKHLKEKGLDRKQSKDAAKQHLERIRELMCKRFS
ncbi:hypothetical protein ACSZN3_05675 [Aeromonas hydrophila]|uniref:hypothetical protein n=1 Tax=Aeromonas hydrophila TaxID=644 RepID=UPI000B007A8E|nr:hypothetical protein [Aeromonas hydrophila]QWL79601.1 hypothetical protein HQ395_12990 [Aeromonas hydrophila]